MASGLKLDDSVLSSAQSTLIGAGHRLVTTSARLPRLTMRSLTGVAPDVLGYLEAVRVAGETLGADANATGQVAGDVLLASTEVDRSLASAITGGVLPASSRVEIGTRA